MGIRNGHAVARGWIGGWFSGKTNSTID